MKKKFKTLFKSGGDWNNDAMLNFQEDMSHGYIEGYKRAADILVKHVGETGYDKDYLVYPIVFLYRHHIELMLKSIIGSGNKYLTGEFKFEQVHDLKRLWDRVKKISHEIFGEDQVGFSFITHIVSELDSVDPKSMNFRYHIDKKCKAPNPDLKCINVRHFAAVITEAILILDGACSAIDYEIESRNEYLSDRRR